LTHNLLDMPSPEVANELQQQQVQEDQEKSDLPVAYEEPFVDEKGEDIGTVTVLEREAGGSLITAVFWNNRYLYAEVLAEDGDAALDFFDELDY
jgi:hypothetical protein